MTDPNPAVPPAPAPPVPAPPAVPPAPGAPAAPPVYVPPANMPGQPAPAIAPAQPQYVPPFAPPPAPVEPADADDWMAKLPEKARNEITKLKDENAQRRISERTALVNQHAYIAAGQLGANAAALLGSTAFAAVATQLNPNDPDFAAKLSAAIHHTVQTNPWMAAAPAVPGAPAPAGPAQSSAGPFAGPGDPNALITEAQLKAMSPGEITKALSEGRLKHLL